MSSKSYMRPPEEIELDAQAVQAGRVGFDMFRGVLESIYRMGYEAGQKAAMAKIDELQHTQNITDPTKPTKPLVKLAEYWEKGAASESMSPEYRRALADCAKGLREELSE